MRAVLLGVVLLLATEGAHADVKPHVEASIWPGYLWGKEMSAGFDGSISGVVIDARAALGLAWFSDSGMAIRGGAVIDAFIKEPHHIAAGIEIQADVDFAPWPGWRIGGRLAGLLGEGNGAALGGQLLVPGVRLRNGSRFVGIDGMFGRSGDGVSRAHANGFMLGAGVNGKPGAVIVGSTAVVSGIVGLLAIIALSNTH